MRKVRTLAAALLVLLALSGCGGDAPELNGAYVLITKSAGNPYNTHMAHGFEDAVKECGGRAVVLEPEKATAEEQIALIRACIRGKAQAIAIAANDTIALDEALKEAMDQGIAVSTMDSNTSSDSHALFVNQVAADAVAEKLLEAVYTLSGGEGAWAILSTTNQMGNQSLWVRTMQEKMTDPRYRDLRLVNIAFGEDDAALSREKVAEMLEAYPNLKVLCAPTAAGMRAAAEVLQEEGSSVKLTGLGLPSALAPYMTGGDPICPVMYLWNPIAIGRLSAYVSLGLTGGSITGAPGETLETPDGRQYAVVESAQGGSEVIVGEPQEFTPENIGQWKDVF